MKSQIELIDFCCTYTMYSFVIAIIRLLENQRSRILQLEMREEERESRITGVRHIRWFYTKSS